MHTQNWQKSTLEFSCLNHQTFPYYNFFTRAPDDGRPEPLESSLGHLYDDTKNAQIRVQEDSQLFVQNQYKKKKKKIGFSWATTYKCEN